MYNGAHENEKRPGEAVTPPGPWATDQRKEKPVARQIVTQPPEIPTESDLISMIPYGGFAGCPWDPKRAPHAWWDWQLAEAADRIGCPIIRYGDGDPETVH